MLQKRPKELNIDEMETQELDIDELDYVKADDVRKEVLATTERDKQ